MTEVAGLETTIDIQERAKSFQDISKSVSWWFPYTNFVMVCNRPKVINRDEKGQLHSDTGKAIEWPDGWGFHALHGVRFDKNPELWQKIVSGELTATDLAKIQDVDIRRVALRYMGGQDFIKSINAVLANEGKEERIFENGKDTVTVKYRLYKVKGGEVFKSDKYFLHYLNPSTAEEHISFVTPYVEKHGEDADAIIAAKHNTTKKAFFAGFSA